MGIETEPHPQAAVITAKHDPISKQRPNNALTDYPSSACSGMTSQCDSSVRPRSRRWYGKHIEEGRPHIRTGFGIHLQVLGA